ncbi:uncharacterized protein GIQ15_06595 [Arthroderma uncinatum]|uniref:uncharacterized protein n=1 Tax=Arthroderma uncinatum TaxID=74035 RepID=UPI00144A9AB1|nr:uncharacterized protein GIQ15_06595 [Arthroderma uncinatum]KAF3479619.1 hypothetical protein GIQ15_06595 [Arthroderma uncinatum]
MQESDIINRVRLLLRKVSKLALHGPPSMAKYRKARHVIVWVLVGKYYDGLIQTVVEGHLIRDEVVDVVGEGYFLDQRGEEGERTHSNMTSHCQSRSADDVDPSWRIVRDGGKKTPVSAEYVKHTAVHYPLAFRAGGFEISGAMDRVDAGSVKVSDGCLLADYTRTSGSHADSCRWGPTAWESQSVAAKPCCRMVHCVAGQGTVCADGFEYAACLAIRGLLDLNAAVGLDPVNPALVAAADPGGHMVAAGAAVELPAEAGQTCVGCQTWGETSGIQSQSIHGYS